MLPIQTLEFDHRRPFGPLKDDESCTTSPKKVSFDAKHSTGYTHGMQLTRLAPRSDLHHIFSLNITGLIPDHGFNAVAVVMDKFDGNYLSDNMFTIEKNERPVPHDLYIYSQFTCPWKNTLLTLVVSPDKSTVDVYVEKCTSASKKRNRDEEAMPYVFNDKHIWTDVGNGLKHRKFVTDFMQNKMPNIGVLLCGFLNNAVEIVSVSPRAIRAIGDKYASESLMMYH